MSKSLHAKVLRTHPDFSHHPGEVVELPTEIFNNYQEKGEFFREATPEEVKNAAQAIETATVPQDTERAIVPAATPKTPADAAKAVKKAAKSTKKDGK